MLAVALAALVTAAAPVQGSVFGPVVAVKGSTFTITTSLSPNGKAVVSAAGARITEQATAPHSALKAGACVMASGTKNGKGVVAALRIGLSAAVKGKCGGGFSGFVGGNRRPPTGTPRRPPAGGFQRTGNVGFAFGQVTKVSGSTLTVKGLDFRTKKATTTTVTLSSKTMLSETKTIEASAVQTKECAFIRGSSTDKGKTVKATDVALTPERNGTCANGFGRPGR